MAFIRNTDKFVEGGSNKFFTDGRAQLALQPTVTSLESEDSGMKLRLDVIEGGAGVSGSIAKAQADAQSYADQQIAALVNSAPEVLDTLKELSDAIGGDQNFAATVSGQIGAVDAKVDQEVLDRQAAISLLQSEMGADVSALESADSALSLRLDELELDPVTKSYVDSQDSSEQSARQSADSALSGRLDVIEGSGEGSVAKAEQDAKDYADGLDSAMDARMLVLEADPTTKAYVDAEDAALDAKIGNLTSLSIASDSNFSMPAEMIAAINQVGSNSSVTAVQQHWTNIEEVIIKTTDGLIPAGTVNATNLDFDNSYIKFVGDSTQYFLDPRTVFPIVGAPPSNGYQFGEDSGSAVLTGSQSNAFRFLFKNANGYLNHGIEVSFAVGQHFVRIVEYVGDGSTTTLHNQTVKGFPTGTTFLNLISVPLTPSAYDLFFSHDARLDILESDPVNKTYVDSADSSLQSNIDAEEQRALAAEGLLSGRLDTLELDPVTKTYVDGEVSDLQGQITQEISDRQSAVSSEQSARQSADSALSGRLDTLEADPTTKTYVDSQDSGLQSQIDTEKGRIDAILSASEADKDSFAEIVQLINSVDTENDTAFAGHVSNYNAYVSSNDAALAQEVSDRQAGDSNLQDNIDAEESARIAADSALSGRLDVLETDPTTKSYVDGQVSNLQGQLTQEISDRQADVDAEETRAISAETAISGRVAVLEADPTTKAYVDGLDSAMDARMDVLENDPRLQFVYSVKSADYTLTLNDYMIGVSSVSGGKTMTLPTAVGNAGRVFMIKEQSGAANSTDKIVIQPQSGELIDGQSNYEITVSYESVGLVSDGSNWFIM